MLFLSLLDRFRKPVLMQLFTVYMRYLIGSAFIIAAIGMGKLSDGVFLMSAEKQSLCELQPIQQFFRVMAESGLYWKFIGWAQIVAGTLLITQRFARIGALIFFGLILNIFIITVSYDFRGTPIVTGMMLLATIYLLLWDANSLQFLFRRPSASNIQLPGTGVVHDSPFWSALGILLIVWIIGSMLIKIGVLAVMSGTLFLGLVGVAFFFVFIVRNKITRV